MSGAMADNLTILVVDDDRELTAKLSNQLTIQGYQVISAHSGEQAIAHLKVTDIDFLISNIHLPGMISGAELCQYIQSFIKPPPRTVLMSGYPEELDFTLAQYPQFGKLNKPFQVDDLLELIN